MVKVMWVSGLALMAAFFLMTVAKIPTVAAEGVTCSPSELYACKAAFTSSSPPSSMCCSKLKEQSPCLCEYAKNPKLSQYVNSPNAKKVLDTCEIPLPKC